MKALWIAGFLLAASSVSAADCVTGRRGETVCRGANGAVVASPGAPVVAPHGTVTTTQNVNGSRAAYNPNTGNAAVSTTNSNGVKTTDTRYGGEAKTKNGMGVAQGPGGKTCAKGRGETKCN